MRYQRGWLVLLLLGLLVPGWPQPARASSLNAEFGVIGAVPSLTTDAAKQTAIDKIAQAGFGWMRHEFTYSPNFDFAPYDVAQNMADAAGIKTLGLLTYPSGGDHTAWKNYVQTVVSHYGSRITAWEVMNEADNYLTASAYQVYLQEAHDIIKSVNSSATVVLSGLTSRIEATSFWDGVAAAGGWNDFDIIGLHIYHSGNPEKVNFGGGDIVGEMDRVVADINQNGGGKKIWITETGYQVGTVGETNQANWLARTLIMARTVPTVTKIFIYRLYDGSGDSYGLLTTSLTERASYGRVKEVISNLGGQGNGSRLYPQTKTVLDPLESISGWKTDATFNGTTSLSTVAGYSGNGMKISYSFNADQAYAVAAKSLPISGTPQALAAWINGDDTRNVWKFRFKDKNGETFQTDLGSIASGWHYKQFTFGTDTAFVSWGGDGVIDFPISFDSIVIDRQGGSASGSGVVDEIQAIFSGADLYAYQFNSNIAYWQLSGSADATLCQATRTFSEAPSYAHGVNCTDTPTTGSVASPAKKSLKPNVIVIKLTPDKDKSVSQVDGNNVPADGKSTFRLVITIRDKDGNLIKDQKPSLTVPDGVTASDPVLNGDEWWVNVSSTSVGEKTLGIKVSGVDLKNAVVTFVAVALVKTATPVVGPLPVVVKNWWQNPRFFGGLSALVLLLVALVLWLLTRRFGWLARWKKPRSEPDS